MMTKKSPTNITCAECKHSILMQYYEGSRPNPLIAECKGERFVARRHTCKEAVKATTQKDIKRINK